MTAKEAIASLRTLCHTCELFPKCAHEKPECFKAIELAISALQAQEWIPVDKKSHPDTPESVQVQLRNGWIITAYYEENEWFSVPYCDEPLQDRWIEAWKPLPEPYKEDI